MNESKDQTPLTDPPAACATGRWASIVAPLVMAVVLLPPAVGLPWAGAKAIREKSIDWSWRAHGGIIFAPVHFGSFSQSGVEPYRGAAAVRFGVGLVSGGVMLGIWVLAFLYGAIRVGVCAPAPANDIGPFWVTLASASLVCLTVATVAFFPPWHFGTHVAPTALYAEWLAAAVLFTVPWTRAQARRWFCPAIILAAVVTSWLLIGIAVGLVLGLLIGILAAAHIAAIFFNKRFLDKSACVTAPPA
jgi:hypothetical protein